MAVWVREYDGGNKGGRKAWWVFIKHEGKTKKKRIGTGTEGRKAAVLVAEKLSARIALNEFAISDEPRLTFGAYAETWLGTYVEHGLRPGTAEKYREVMRVHWIPAFGRMALQDLTRQKIRAQVVKFQQQGFQNNTIRYWLNVLQSCCTAAIQDNKLQDNPAAQSTKGLLRKLTPKAHEIETFTAPELLHLLRTAEKKGPMTHAILMTLARTGMRISEVMGLQVGDLDFERREIHLRRTWGNRSRGPDYHGPLKSGKTRLVDMSQQLKDTLQAYVTSTEPRNWLFPAAHGRPMTPNSYYLVHWRPLFVGGVVQYRHPHVLRHTYATDMLSLGQSPVYVKEQLGHASIKITVDLYGQWIRTWSKDAVDALDEKQSIEFRQVPSGFRTAKNGLGVDQNGGRINARKTSDCLQQRRLRPVPSSDGVSIAKGRRIYGKERVA